MLTKEIVRDEFVEFFDLDIDIVEHALSYYDGRDIDIDYHTIKHLYDMLQYIKINNLTKTVDSTLLGYAILYHDAIYDLKTSKGMNEYNSAKSAYNHLRLHFSEGSCDVVYCAIIDTGKDLQDRTYNKDTIKGILNLADIHTFFTDSYEVWRDAQNKVTNEYLKVYSKEEVIKGRLKFFEGFMLNQDMMKKLYNIVGEKAFANYVKNIAAEHRLLAYTEFPDGYKNKFTL